MNNTNQHLYSIYEHIQSFYNYRKLVSLDQKLTQEQFITTIQKDKYILLSAAKQVDVVNDAGEVDDVKLAGIKELISSYNEKSNIHDIRITNILLVYPGTDCESKRANMNKLINHIRFPQAEVIIVTPTKISAGVSKSLVTLASHREHRNHTFKAFTYTLFNSVLPEHELVPRYEILNAEQVNHLKEWFVDSNALPKIFENDPQMVWIGAAVGDVVKFTYLSEVTIESIRYCKVVASV